MTKYRSRNRKPRSPSLLSSSDVSAGSTCPNNTSLRKRQSPDIAKGNIPANSSASEQWECGSDREMSGLDEKRSPRRGTVRVKPKDPKKKHEAGSRLREIHKKARCEGSNGMKPYKEASKLAKSLKKPMEELLSEPLGRIASTWEAQLRWLDDALQGYDNADYLCQLEAWLDLERAAGPLLWAQWEKTHAAIGSIMVDFDREQVRIQAQQDAQQTLLNEFEAQWSAMIAKHQQDVNAIREEMARCKNKVGQQVAKYVDQESVVKETEIAMQKVVHQLFHT